MELAQNSLSSLYDGFNKKMDKYQVNKLIKDTLEGLQQLYFQKITHRDIKPQNILQMSNGDFKIADFGTSRILNNEVNSITIIGTLPYLPPEIKKYYQDGVDKLSKEEAQHIDWYAFDTYSLGLTFAVAVCQIQKMPEYQILKKRLEISQSQNYYDPLVFKIINLMIQQQPYYRPTPSELIKIAKPLKIK